MDWGGDGARTSESGHQGAISGNLAEQAVNPAAENWLNCRQNRRNPDQIRAPSTTPERVSARFVKSAGID
jgi:hypothetical protein